MQIRVFSGRDPVTGKDVYLAATVKGTDTAARRKAEDKLAELRSQVIKQRTASSSVTLTYTLDEWLRVTEIEDSARKGYVSYIELIIKPAHGAVQVKKLDARTLESFYTELRRCRARCDGTPYIEKHKSAEVAHDCKQAECKTHECRPMSASTVRQIHAILSRCARRGRALELNSKQPDPHRP